MQESGQRASRLDSATINCVEAALMTPLVGASVDATVIEMRGERATVQIADPAVTASAPVPPDTVPGAIVRLRVERVDVTRGEIEFAV